MATRFYKGKILEVHDADTFKVEIDLGFYTTVKQWLRLKGIDTDELGGERGEAARIYVQRLMPTGTPIDMDVELVKTRKGEEDYKWTFRRFVASVTLPSGEDLATHLRVNGFVKAPAPATPLAGHPDLQGR